MRSYHYQGLTQEGSPVQGVLDAENLHQAEVLARQRCHTLENIEPMYAHSLNRLLHTDMAVLLSGGRLPDKKLALLCARLAIQLRSGFPLVRALRLTGKTEPDKNLRQSLDQVADDVHDGNSLAQALRRRLPMLPELFTETVRAGELSGTLDTGLQRLSEYYAGSAALSRRISGALLYPALLLATAVLVVLVILIYAVPVFQDSFARMGQELPLPTQLLIRLSDFLSRYLPLLLGGTALGLLALSLALKSPQGRSVRDRLVLGLPVLGGVIRARAAARYAAGLASLLGAGLPLPQAAQIAGAAEGNLRLRRSLDRAAEGMERGRTLAAGLRSSPLPLLLTETVALGEETGSLAQSLTLAAGHFSAEAEDAVSRLLTLLEPCITLVLAALVIFLLLCVYLPIFGMYGGI